MARDQMTGVIPVDRATIQSQVYDELRRRLFLGELQPGQALKINTLAEAFGTSAQPVRESIRQLIAERALDALANRSARVPVLDEKQLEDLRRTRLAVEGLTTELATERCSAEDLETLQAMTLRAQEADQSGAVAAAVAINLEFHFTLYRMSGSEELPPIIESLWLRIGPLVRPVAEAPDDQEGRYVSMHQAVVDAMRAGDAVAARAAIEADINRFFDLTLRLRAA